MIELTDKYNKTYHQCQYDIANNWVHSRYLEFSRTDEIIEANKTVLEMLKESPTDKLLSDNSLLKGSWTGAVDWLEENWFKYAEEYGLKKHATVLSEDQFSLLSQESHEKGNKNISFEMKTLSDVEAAERWLKA